MPDDAREAMLGNRPEAGPGHYVRDVVYGANDGAVTTIAVVAGVAGAAFSPVVALVLGLANLLADGFSMAAANYLSLRSDLMQRGIPVALERPLRHAAATFASFVVAGGFPLLAYVAPTGIADTPRLMAAIVVALTAMGLVGLWRARYIGRSRARSAAEAIAVGGAAAFAAYAVGWLARGLIA